MGVIRGGERKRERAQRGGIGKGGRVKGERKKGRDQSG